MGIRINYSTSKRRNTEICISEINVALTEPGRKKIMLLVPEQYSSYYEQLLVEKSSENGSFFAEVLTFKRLAYRVFAGCLYKSDRYIDSAGKSMLMFRVVSDLYNGFEAFGKAGRYPAFSGEAVNAVREFKRYGITPEMLEEAADKSSEGLLEKKLREMASIYGEYEKQMSEDGYNDADDNLRDLAMLLKKENEFSGAKIWIDGFDGFTPAETEVISSLISTSTSVVFSFCCESLDTPDRTDVFYPVVKNAVKIQKEAEKLGLYTRENYIGIPDSAMSGRPGELDHLSSQYYKFPGTQYTGSCNALKFHKAESIYDEVRRCALEITKQVRSGRFRYGDICVVSGLYSEYREYIDAVFSIYGIPVFLDEKRSIAKHPLAVYIIALLDIYINKYSYDSVMQFLKSSYMDIDYDEISRLENYLRQWDIRGTGIWTGEDWDFTAGFRQDDEVLESVNSTRRSITAVTEPFFSVLRYGADAREFSSALFNFLVANGIFEKINSAAAEAAEEGRHDYSDELKQSWNFLMEILNQVTIVAGDGKHTADTYRKMLELAFSEKKIGVIPPRTDEVFAGGIGKAYGMRARMLMILGANEPGFPDKVVSEGLLSDKDRADIRKLGLELAPDTKEQVLNSLIDTYNLLSLPEDILYASYSERGPDGSQRRRSVFFDRAEALFENVRILDSDALDASDYAMTPLSGLDLLQCASDDSVSAAIPGRQTALERWYRENGMFTGVADSKFDSDKRIFRYVIQELLGSSLESSPTDIENYIRCPYKYFAQNALRLDERKEFEVSAPDIGSIIHGILKDLVKSSLGIPVDEIPSKRDQFIAMALEKLGSMRAGKVFSRDDRFRHLGDRVARRAVSAFELLMKQLDAGDFEPVGFEAAFGGGSDIRSPEFNTGDHSIYLKGRIDRIDESRIGENDYFRIIDYKSSDKELKLYRINEGLDIQLASYLMTYGNVQDKYPAGMYYFATKNRLVPVEYGYDPDYVESEKYDLARMEGYTIENEEVFRAMDRGFSDRSEIIPVRYDKRSKRYKKALTEEEIDRMTARVGEIIVENTRKIYECDFPAEPVNDGGAACAYCSYKSICGFDIRKPGCDYRQVGKVKDEDVEWGVHG